MIKKKFDPKNPPVFGGLSTPIPTRQEVEREQDLLGLIDFLRENDDYDGDTSGEIFADIMDIVMDISAKNWDRARQIVLDNIEHVKTPKLPESVLMDLIDLSLEDPQINGLSKRVDICRLTYGFKNLADVPEIEAAVPRKGALALLEIADKFSEKGSGVSIEVHNMRNMIDPTFTIPSDEKYDLH